MQKRYLLASQLPVEIYSSLGAGRLHFPSRHLPLCDDAPAGKHKICRVRQQIHRCHASSVAHRTDGTYLLLCDRAKKLGTFSQQSKASRNNRPIRILQRTSNRHLCNHWLRVCCILRQGSDDLLSFPANPAGDRSASMALLADRSCLAYTCSCFLVGRRKPI